MNCIDVILAPASSTENQIFRSEVSSCKLPKGDAEEVGHSISAPRSRLPMSISGVVDSILEVGNRRKALLDLLRSALVSSNDPEALGFARQLRGLPV
jgi:hypothetical protein